MIPYVHHIAGATGTSPMRGGERGLEAAFSDLAPHHVHTHKSQLSGLIPLRISPVTPAKARRTGMSPQICQRRSAGDKFSSAEKESHAAERTRGQLFLKDGISAEVAASSFVAFRPSCVRRDGLSISRQQFYQYDLVSKMQQKERLFRIRDN